MDPCLLYLLCVLGIPWCQLPPWGLLAQVDLQDLVLLPSLVVPEMTCSKMKMIKTIPLHRCNTFYTTIFEYILWFFFFSFQRLDFVFEQATTWYKSFSHSRSWPVWNINPSYCRIILVWFFQHALLPSLHQVLEGQVDPLHPVQTCDPCFRFRTATCVGNAAKTSLKNVSTRIHTIRNSSF